MLKFSSSTSQEQGVESLISENMFHVVDVFKDWSGNYQLKLVVLPKLKFGCQKCHQIMKTKNKMRQKDLKVRHIFCLDLSLYFKFIHIEANLKLD